MGLLCLVLVLMLHLSWSLSSSIPPSSHLCLPNQRAALLQLKNSIFISEFCGDDYYNIYPKTESWNISIDCCSWEGVKCDNLAGHVIGIDLSHSCITDPLFASANNSFFHLHSLQWLEVSYNDINGFLSGLFHLHGLRRLNLAYNRFGNTVPSELFTRLVSLTHLNLSVSGFNGVIPYQISFLSSLVSLDLSSHSIPNFTFDGHGQGFAMLATNLTKLITLMLDTVHGEFPTRVFQFPNLKHIDLGSNQNLGGYLPQTNWSSGLELLDLSDCGGFRGSIPPSFEDLIRIISIDLSGNSLQGQIPDAFGNITRLTSLRFSSCNLSGPLPITIFNLTQITTLDLSHNHLEGPFPNHVSGWLFTLPSLLHHNKLAGPIDRIQMPSVQHFDLGYNDFDGPFPHSVFDLVNLTSLRLSSNNLSGVIEPVMLLNLTSLVFLDLSNNSLLSLRTSSNDVNYFFPWLQTVLLSGCSIRQFPSFFRTPYLEVLDLSYNKISGGISKWEAQGWEELQVLNLSHNFLTTLEQFPGKTLQILDLRSNLLQGPILSTCFNLQTPDQRSLEILDLAKNSVSGTIPECLGNFSYHLQFINLQMNNLYGKIPDSFGNNSLSHLFLNDNRFEGLVPPSLSNSTKLEVLDLGNNKLTDRFSQWLEIELIKTAALFVSMDLSNNQSHGQIPEEVGQLISLQMLNFSHNNFTGPIPTLFGNLVALESLDLSSNKLSGRIPSQMTKLIFLAALNLSENNLVGQIPHGNQFGTFENDSYSGNLGLCGLPLSKLCNNHGEAESPAPSVAEQEDSQVPKFWQVVMMGYGSGVVLGMSLGYIVFTTGRPWWFVSMVERHLQYKFTNWIRRKRPRRN
ncbi:receptor like protein 34 [Hibiscus trionum]|uniref:Receptor like protein 34 n=1 Tax=Hibiscus trionum TaxID=183268 RepID=A0A9W7ITV5_HIBTR|nr:receptor like protein 34 [Hibiscus trionum]